MLSIVVGSSPFYKRNLTRLAGVHDIALEKKEWFIDLKNGQSKAITISFGLDGMPQSVGYSAISRKII